MKSSRNSAPTYPDLVEFRLRFRIWSVWSSAAISFANTQRYFEYSLGFSIAISLLILLTVIYVKDPPEFSVFPTLLLAVTLYRLGLNVASTRLILLDGDAGSVIQSFRNLRGWRKLCSRSGDILYFGHYQFRSDH